MANRICQFHEEQVKRIEAAITCEWEKATTILQRAGVGKSYVSAMPNLARQKRWEMKWQTIKSAQTAMVYRLPPAN